MVKPTAASDSVQSLHSVVHSYLATLLTLSEAVGVACPEVGLAHGTRLARLRTRLSFDASKEAIEASTSLVRAELRDFAQKTAGYTTRAVGEWKQAADESGTIAYGMLKRQSFYGSRLRDFAKQLRKSTYPTDPIAFADLLERQAATLESTVDSMLTESESSVLRIEQLLQSIAARIADLEVVDRATGLMNRREMERRIALQTQAGNPLIRLLFWVEWDGPASWHEAILRQAAVRLTSQLRPDDLVARWGEREFLVLFQGTSDVALRRGPEVARLMSGPYPMDTGTPALVQAQVQFLDQAVAPETV